MKRNILILSGKELSLNYILTKVLNRRISSYEPNHSEVSDYYKDDEAELFNRYGLFYDRATCKFMKYEDCEDIGYIGKIADEDIDILKDSTNIDIVRLDFEYSDLKHGYIVEFINEDEN